jgi:hypothetical protein
MVRAAAVTVLLALTLTGAAPAHAPTTAIGRAVEALRHVDVSYDPAAVAVSEVEAGGFDLIAGDGVAVAVLPASALSEIVGGPDAVAAEIAREAGLRGTLVALVGTRLTAWSDAVARPRLVELTGQARTTPGPPARQVEALVRSVRAEPTDGSGDMPWGWIVAVGSVLLAVGAVVARSRGQSPSGTVPGGRGRTSPGPGDP